MPQTSNRLVITGAGGFIGRHLVAAALREGYEVTALVRKQTGDHDFPQSERLIVAEWDAASGSPNANLFDSAKAVCHLAAFYPPDMASPQYAEQCLSVNALGTLRLLENIAGRDVHLIYISGGNLYRNHGRLAREDDQLWPASRAVYYLSSKMLGELYVDYFTERFGLRATKLRIGSVYGPGMHGGAIPNFINKAQQGLPIEIAKKNTYTVDLVYVEDVACAIIAAVRNNVLGTFNIGTGIAYPLKQIALETLAACNAPDSLLHMVESSTPPDPGFPGLDITQAKQALGFVPTSLLDGLRKTINDN